MCGMKGQKRDLNFVDVGCGGKDGWTLKRSNLQNTNQKYLRLKSL
jgi:hypothetical protein